MFGQVMSLWAIVGACIIIAAVIFNVLVKAMKGGSHLDETKSNDEESLPLQNEK